MSAETKSYKLLGPLGSGDIISLGWRLYRLNFKKVFLYTLLATPVMLISQILLQIPQTYVNDPQMLTASYLCICPSGCIAMLGGLFIATFFNVCLCKTFFYILTGKDHSIRSVLQEVKEQIVDIIFFCVILIIEIIVFYLLDVIVVFLLIMLSGILGGFSTAALSQHGEGLMFFAGAVFCLVMFFISIVISIFILFQFLLCGFQFVSLCVEDTKKSLFAPFIKSIDLLSANILRSSGFMFCLMFIIYVLIFYFNVPPMIYVFYEMFKEGMVAASNYTYSLPSLIITSLWGSSVNMLIWPMIISALTLYYYDVKVRNEGFDLKQAIRYEKGDRNITII